MEETDNTCIPQVTATLETDVDANCTSHMCDYCCPVTPNSVYVFAAILLVGLAVIIYLQKKILKHIRKR